MKLAIFALAAVFSSSAFASMINSSTVTVNPARITNRVVLVDKQEKALRVLVTQEFLHGATDVSNTSRIIFSISTLGEMSESEANFVIGESMGGMTAKRVAGGVYEISYSDAQRLDSGKSLEVKKTIDARKALASLNQCGEFESCVVRTTIEVK